MGVLREAWVLLKPAAAGAVCGCALYFAADTASDIYTFCAVRRQALERVRASSDVAALIGEPFASGPWYNGTLGFSHRDRVAHCTFQVVGSARTTDVVARAARRPGMKVNFLYNAFGGGQWDLITCQAMFPGEGGLAAPRNLMEPLPVVAALQGAAAVAVAGGGGVSSKAAAAGAGGSGGECLPCQQQQQQKGVGEAKAATSKQQGLTWWDWAWGGGRGGSSGSGAA